MVSPKNTTSNADHYQPQWRSSTVLHMGGAVNFTKLELPSTPPSLLDKGPTGYTHPDMGPRCTGTPPSPSPTSLPSAPGMLKLESLQINKGNIFIYCSPYGSPWRK